jgi:pimeloyl-ACP methyl ester carboxylesterase
MKIELGKMHLAFDDAGRGPVILFLHGYPLNRQMWAHQLNGLQREARLLALDLRGHGESDAPAGPYSMGLFADDIAAFLDKLGVTEPVIVCGMSMGGYITFEFFRRYPGRVAGLILTATRAGADSSEAKANRDRAMETARTQGPGAIAAAMLPKLLSPRTPELNPQAEERVKSILAAASLEGILGDLAALRDRADSLPTLPAIKVPTLILHGMDDLLIPLIEAETMQRGIANSWLHALTDAGHMPNLEQPELFNGYVRRFLDQFFRN